MERLRVNDKERFSGKNKDGFRVLNEEKGTVSVILSDPPCKDVNAQITTLPLKALSDQV